MNEIPFSDLNEETEIDRVRLAVANGWMILEIYRRKRQVPFSEPPEFEEYAVYILGNPDGG